MTRSADAMIKFHSRIPPQTDWQEFPYSQIVTVPAQDDELVEFIVKGRYVVDTFGSRRFVLIQGHCFGAASLQGQLCMYVAKAVTPQLSARRRSLPKEITVFLLGAWRLPGNNDVALLVGLAEPAGKPFPLGFTLERSLQGLLEEHLRLIADWEAEKNAEVARHGALFEQSPFSEKFHIGIQSWHPALVGGEFDSRRPKITLGAALSDFPCAAFIDGAPPRSAKALERAAIQAVARSGFPPSRDGQYSGVIAGRETGRVGIVMWKPHVGFPSYPEIRWAVQTVLPRAMARPRLSDLGRPKLEDMPAPFDAIASITLPDELELWTDILSETPMDDTDLSRRIGKSRHDRSANGFEAIACFKPYHAWTEETWGIHIDAERLDDFALSIWADCGDWRCHISFGLASILAVGLIHAHEMFHARVEAASSWLELNAESDRYRRYQKEVYGSLIGTSDCLEEALANWCAWDWFKGSSIQALLSAQGVDPENLTSVIKGVLDLSPPGYQDWRAGHDRETWRKFASQLAHVRRDPRPKGGFLPLESIFRDPLPYDLIASDIPTWIEGSGKIADQLHSHPASFNVPSRREAEKLLRHFKHRHVPARGKGSHEQWVGLDDRAFPLPARDPLSREVFSSLLSHLGIDKKTYVRDIRPKL